MDIKEHRFTGVEIPAGVWCAKLSPTAKLLWGEIHLRDGLNGCDATEDELADSLGVTVKLIRAAIGKLVAANLIVKEGRKGRKRVIRAVNPSSYHSLANLPSGHSETVPNLPSGHSEKTDYTLVGFELESSSISLSKSKNKSKIRATATQLDEASSKDSYSLFLSEFFKLHKQKTGTKPIMDGRQGKIIKTILAQQALEDALSKLRRYYEDDTLWFTKDGGRSLMQFRHRYNDIPTNGAKNGGYHGRVSDKTREEWQGVFDEAETKSIGG